MSSPTEPTAAAERNTLSSLHHPSREPEEVHPLSRKPSITGKKAHGFRAGVGLENVARRTLGIIMLLATVLLWTTSNFLASVGQAPPLEEILG